jgi:transposase-like protein
MRAAKSEDDEAGLMWTPPPQGRRWTEDEVRAGLETARASGEPISRFARRHGVQASRLYWWKKQLRSKAGKPAAFLPVQVVEKQVPARQPETAPVEVIVGGRVVRVGRGFDPVVLRAVVVALELEPC